MAIARLLLFVFPLILSGCSMSGNSLFGSDPFTGGINDSHSTLADIPLPAGLQRYPNHGFINSAANGEKNGLETLRGHVNEASTLRQFHDSLRQAGWQLLTAQQKGSRARYLFSKNNEYLSIVSRPQGNLTIFELWRGQKQDDASFLPEPPPDISIAPEEYSPLVDHAPESNNAPVTETWGTPIEEREL